MAWVNISVGESDDSVRVKLNQLGQDVNSAILDQAQMVYFGKAGSDAKSGLNMGSLKLTLAGAKAAGLLLTPAENNQIVLEGVGSGIYLEDLDLPEWMHIRAPSISFNGELDIADNCIVVFRRLSKTSLGGSVVTKTTGAGFAKVSAELLIVSDSTQNGVLLNSGVMHIDAGVISVDGGIGIKAKNGSRVSYNVAEFQLLNGGTGIGTQVAGGDPNFFSGHILYARDDGTGTLVKSKVSGDVIDLTGGSFIVNELFDIGANSTLNVFSTEAVGSTTADPTATINAISSKLGQDVMRGGWANYNDLGTATTPLNVIGGDPAVKILNDGLGPFTLEHNLPTGVTSLYNISTQQFDLTDLRVDDIFVLRFDLEVTTSVNSQEVNVSATFAIGSPSEFTVNMAQGTKKLAGTIGFFREVSFAAFSTDFMAFPAEIKIESDGDCTVKTNGFFLKAALIGS